MVDQVKRFILILALLLAGCSDNEPKYYRYNRDQSRVERDDQVKRFNERFRFTQISDNTWTMSDKQTGRLYIWIHSFGVQEVEPYNTK